MQSLQVCCKSQSHCKCTQIYMEMRKKAVTLLQRHQNNIHSNYCPNCINSCKNPRIEDMPLGPRLRACCPHFTAFSSLRFSPGTRLASHHYTALTSRSSNRLAASSHGVSRMTICGIPRRQQVCVENTLVCNAVSGWLLGSHQDFFQAPLQGTGEHRWMGLSLTLSHPAEL